MAAGKLLRASDGDPGAGRGERFTAETGTISWRWFRTERPTFLAASGRKSLAAGKFLRAPAGGLSARRAVRPRGRSDFLALVSHRAADFFGDIREEELGRREILARSGRRSLRRAKRSVRIQGRSDILALVAHRARDFFVDHIRKEELGRRETLTRSGR